MSEAIGNLYSISFCLISCCNISSNYSKTVSTEPRPFWAHARAPAESALIRVLCEYLRGDYDYYYQAADPGPPEPLAVQRFTIAFF